MSRLRPAAAIIAALATKREEAEYLGGRLSAGGLAVSHIDTSLRRADWLSGEEKLAAMGDAVTRARSELQNLASEGSLRAIAGLGGGTGTQLATQVMSTLERSVTKVLVTTMANDPRPAAAVSGIVLIPAVADLAGLNSFTREALDKAAAVISALASLDSSADPQTNDHIIGISALGITGSGAEAAAAHLRFRGYDPVMFHANGYGGNAMAEQVKSDRLVGVIDFTIHEAVSLCLDPFTTVMRDRFKATGRVPRVVLPGGVNVFTIERGRQLPFSVANRPVYPHSPAFSHIGLSVQDMAAAGSFLGRELTCSASPTSVILPMAGFSSEDRQGGAVENSAGRAAFADALEQACGRSVAIRRLPTHINDAETATRAAETLLELLQASHRNNVI